MSEPFLGELKIVSFNFPPRGWALCNGQLLSISQNQALFSLLGTTYGGNGTTTFALPDFRGRTPLHFGDGFFQGQRGGEENHTLLMGELPNHSHAARASNVRASIDDPSGLFWAAQESTSAFAGTPTGTMTAAAVTSVGGGQAHPNMQPFLVLNVIIALQGIFPSRN